MPPRIEIVVDICSPNSEILSVTRTSPKTPAAADRWACL
jgi:hypothetical protein